MDAQAAHGSGAQGTGAPVRDRPFAALAASVVLLGLADSFLRTYFVLFLVDDAGLDPVRAGLLTSVPAVVGIGLSIALGRRFDRRPTRRWVVLSVLVSAAGYALLTTTTSFWWLLLLSATLLAAYNVPYPQLFSLAPVVLGEGPAGRRGVPLLRSGWSLSWAVGPLAGAALLPVVGFTGLVHLAVGVLLVLVVTTAAVPAPPPAAPREPAADGPRRRTVPTDVVLLTTGVGLFFLALFAGSFALPLHVTRTLDLPAQVLGWAFSACAVVEVVAALAVAALPHRVGQRRLVVVGTACLAVHLVLVVLADGPVLVLVSQVPRGAAIAVLTSAGLRFLQDRMRPATGLATTLFSSAADAGGLLAGVLGGVAVAAAGTRGALAGCAVVAVGAVLLLAAGSRPRAADVPGGPAGVGG